MEEFLDNLLFSALFPPMDRWRRFEHAPQPPDPVLRVFNHVSARLAQRYGFEELDDLVEMMRLREVASGVLRKIRFMRERYFWSAITRTTSVN